MTIPTTPPLLYDIVDTVDSGQSRGAGAAAWQEFQQAHQALTEMVRGDTRASNLFKHLLTAAHELTPDEVRQCLEFVYSHLVSKYQGNLAEYLAANELSAWLSERIACGLLGPDVIFVSGDTTRERRLDPRKQQWLKGADGLLVADRGDADSLFIAGVVEIKSFPATFARIRPQLEAHVDRLQHGLRIGDSSWLPDRLFAVRWVKRKGWLDGIEPADWKRVLRILVSPCRRGSGRAETIRPPCHKLTLPVSHATLAAAAYELTVRFLESIGTKLFADERPWPEMTPEEAATNAMQEALYHILLEERAGRPHALWVAKRLYNVYGFGLDAADKHRKMMWSSGDGDPTDRPEDPPDAEPPASSCVKALLHGAWHHFRSGDFQHAESWVQAALQEDAEEAETRRAPWLLGMTHFYQAEFAHACEVLPDPGPRPTPDDGSWPKDMLTLTRARARCGQLERAQEIVDVLVQEDLRWDYLSVALPTVKGWVAHGRGDTDSVDALLAEACENIEGLRDEQRVRTETGQGSPPYHDPGAIQAAVVDTAMLLAVRGRHDEAFQLLKPVEALFPPVLGLLASDPVFDPVRRGAGFKRWLLDRRRE